MFAVNVAIIAELKSFLAMSASEPHLRDLFCGDALKDFSRRRCLSFERLVLFITKLAKKTLSLELERFFAELSETAGPHPEELLRGRLLPCCVSAYCQQRKKLHACFFRLWNDVLCRSFYHYSAQQDIKRWCGLRVVAADGSTAALVSTQALSAHFGGQSNRHGAFTAARTFYYFDVLNELIVHSLIAPYRTAELDIAQSRIADLPDDTVTLYDRNFSTYKMMALHQWAEQPKRFVIRAKERLKPVAAFVRSGAREAVIDLLPAAAATIRSLKESGFVITPATAVTVRLVRVTLPGGGVEVLFTNLMAEEGYGCEGFAALYFLRWGVETAIGVQKNILMLEAFSGLRPQSVEQDFYATVLLANLQSCLMKDAQRTLDKERREGGRKTHKHPVQVNRNKAAARLKEGLVALFATQSPEQILEKLHGHFAKNVLPVRKGRRLQRRRKNKRLNTKHKTLTNYKPAC